MAKIKPDKLHCLGDQKGGMLSISNTSHPTITKVPLAHENAVLREGDYRRPTWEGHKFSPALTTVSSYERVSFGAYLMPTETKPVLYLRFYRHGSLAWLPFCLGIRSHRSCTILLKISRYRLPKSTIPMLLLSHPRSVCWIFRSQN